MLWGFNNEGCEIRTKGSRSSFSGGEAFGEVCQGLAVGGQELKEETGL